MWFLIFEPPTGVYKTPLQKSDDKKPIMCTFTWTFQLFTAVTASKIVLFIYYKYVEFDIFSINAWFVHGNGP